MGMKKEIFNGAKLMVARIYRGKTVDQLAKEVNINKKDIITGIDRPIKFKEKHELVAKIIQFIKENVFKYQ